MKICNCPTCDGVTYHLSNCGGSGVAALTPRQHVEALPKSIRVGGFDFAIGGMTANQAAGLQRWGECSTCEQRIAIQLDMPSNYKAVDTVLHEVGHALYWVYGVDDADKEERIVSALASGWMALYRDNPWLLDWIRKALHP